LVFLTAFASVFDSKYFFVWKICGKIKK